MEHYMFGVESPIQSVQAGKCDLPPHWMHQERTLDNFILYIIIDGEFYLEAAGTPHVFRPGDVFLMKPGAHHIGYKPHAVKFFWLHFTLPDYFILNDNQALEFLEADQSKRIVLPETWSFKRIETFITLINQIIHFYKSQKQATSRYLATALLLEIAAQFAVTRKPKQIESSNKRRFDEIVAYIDANYKEDLSVSAIAQKFDYNQAYLTKLSKQYLQMTIKEYIIDSKLRASEFLLLSSSETISTIAHSCGFANEFYFMRLFKKKYGFSPTTYRNNFHSQLYTRY